jgi:choline-glycine betaine transporter
MERSSYILNLMVQTTGYYFQYSIFQLPFHSDAFGQLREGEGRAIDGNAAATWWMDAWTIFYVSKRFNCV